MEAYLTGLGLSGSAGLNAYLPLLILGVMHRAGWMELQAPYDNLGSIPILILLTILLIIEMGVDKIPGLDHANDIIGTVIRPVAGAILFTASTHTATNVDPTLMTAATLLGGGASAGSVHALKATARPGVTMTTGGTGNMVVSVIEDIISATVSVFAILLPFVVLLFATSAVSLTGWLVWDIRRSRRYFRLAPAEVYPPPRR